MGKAIPIGLVLRMLMIYNGAIVESYNTQVIINGGGLNEN
jgi:hypothetical protein